ncbi:MAG TPA: glycoside hydrolase family 43 protein [Ignavibacteria bacterium]
MKKINFLSLIIVILFVNFVHSQQKEYTNPILSGFYPDPSICRVGNDYYLVTSTFCYFPGLPVFHSKDLVHWVQIGSVMNNPEIMKLDGLQLSEGLFAPTIRYNKGWFYVTCTLVGGKGNFIVKSKRPEGPYSLPEWIPEINGIDPSLFFDENGKTYIVYNSVAPDNKELYRGHRTIRIREFDIEKMKVDGEEHIIVNGGTDIVKKPIWIEGPHIFKKNGYYYLLASEGGTREVHSVVIFRSKDIFGPYESYEGNPLLTHRHLDPKRFYPITCTGHADYVQTNDGKWYSVLLGSRPYEPFEKNHFNTGRETYLVPMNWDGDWPIMNPGFNEVQYSYSLPLKPYIPKGYIPQSENFTYKDEFNNKLNNNWIFLRTPKFSWYSLSQKKGFLSLKLRPETCSEKVNPSFIARRQQHIFSNATIKMKFYPRNDNEKAGLIIFQNEDHFYYLCKSIMDGKNVIQLYKSSNGNDQSKIHILDFYEIKKHEINKDVFLKIESKGNIYSFSFSFDNKKWSILKDSVDATFLSTETAGGFVGCVYGLYATSLGTESNNYAFYDWFRYEGNELIYKNKINR